MLCAITILVGSAANAQNDYSFSLAGVNSSQVILLKNGEILRGRVIRKSDRVAIRTDQGSELILQRDKVDAVTNSLEEAYWHLAAQTSATDVEGQIGLFRWCLKHELLEQARQHVFGLMHTDIPPSKLMQLNEQLEILVVAKKRNADRLASSQPGAVQRPLTSTQPDNDWRAETPERQPSVRQVGFQQTIVDSDTASAAWTPPRSPHRPMLSSRELERELSKLPRGSVGKFRRYVEPIFLSSCFAARCHDGETTLTFMKMPGGNPLRYSQRNLHALLENLAPPTDDRDNVWEAVSEPHAGNAEPLFAADSREYQLIQQWIESLPGSPTIESAPTQPTQPAATGWKTEIPSADSTVPDGVLPTLNPIEAVGDIPQLNQMPSLRPNSYVPVDPYDPEVFNRRKRER